MAIPFTHQILYLGPTILFFIISSLPSGGALYNADTDKGIYILTEENFNVTVYQNYYLGRSQNQPITTANHYWMIQFYNAWCGHCIKYSRIFKAFAANKVQHWSNTLKVGTVDCSDNINRILCSRFAIHHTPVLRFFVPLASINDKGQDLDIGRSSAELLDSVLDSMEHHGKPVELVPLSNQPISQLWRSLPANVNELAIIFEPVGSYVGKESVMHLLPNSHVMAVRRAYSNNQALLDSLRVTERSTFVVFLDRRHMNERGVVTLESLVHHRDPVEVFTEAIIRADTELTNRQNIQRRPKLTPVYGDLIKRPESRPNSPSNLQAPVPTKVSRVDLNSAVVSALSNEIGQNDEISGERYDQLRHFVRGVIKWVPVEPITLAALRNIDSDLQRRNYMTGMEIVRLLQQSRVNFADGAIEWANCRGSVPDRRGYPCGLWQIFHTMSIRAYLENPEGNALAPDGFLTAVVGYVEHFFSCGECSRNFMRGVQNLQRNQGVLSNRDAVLFLWRAHNEANRLLAGDFSEDPLYPKQQFPSLVQCMNCRNSMDPHATVIVWNETNVLRFLQNFYGTS